MGVPDLDSGGSFVDVQSDFNDLGSLPDVGLSGFLEEICNEFAFKKLQGLQVFYHVRLIFYR
jgi:hypothetical protein